jgi:hypothetical protein
MGDGQGRGDKERTNETWACLRHESVLNRVRHLRTVGKRLGVAALTRESIIMSVTQATDSL